MLTRLNTTMCAAVVVVSYVTACKSKTYEDCIVDVGKSRSAREAEYVCREAFHDSVNYSPLMHYSGTFWYNIHFGKQCSSISFMDAQVMDSDPGDCGSKSLIECSGATCWFTCASHQRSDTAVVSIVSKDSTGIILNPD